MLKSIENFRSELKADTTKNVGSIVILKIVLPCKFERTLQHVSIEVLNPFLYEICYCVCVFS